MSHGNAARQDATEWRADCPCCGDTRAFSTWLKGQAGCSYVRCRGCSTVFANPRSTVASRTATLSTQYGAVGAVDLRARGRALGEEAAIIKTLCPGGRLLDVGCERGHLFGWFRPPDWQCAGVDLAEPAVRFAREKYGVDARTGDIADAAFPTASFDVVTMIDMICYLDEPRAELLEARRVLRPGGLLGIEVPGAGYQLLRSRGPLCLLLDRTWTRIRPEGSYVVWPTLRGMSALLSESGFAIEDISVIGSPRSSRRVVEGISRLHRGLMSLIRARLPRSLDWAPKLFLVARACGAPR